MLPKSVGDMRNFVAAPAENQPQRRAESRVTMVQPAPPQPVVSQPVSSQPVSSQPAIQFPDAQQPDWPGKRIATRREARRVRRIVYGFELWSVLKVSLLFYLCVWGVFLLAGLLLWGFANSSGYIERFENFILEIFNYETFTLNGSEIFRWYVWAGLFSVLALTALTVILCLLYNLISILVGGIRMTVVEEETVRFRRSRFIRYSRPNQTPNPPTGQAHGN